MIRIPECFSADCFQMQVLEKIPRSSASWEFTLDNTPLVTDSFLPVGLSCSLNPGKYSTRFQLLLHRFPAILCEKGTSWILPLDLAIFQLLLCYRSFSPDTIRNRNRQVLLHLSTGSLDHETLLISSKMERCCESYSHSESLQNVPMSNSLWYWISSECPRSSCSCRLPNSPNNLVQDEWLLSLTKTWKSTYQHISSSMLPLKMLSILL